MGVCAIVLIAADNLNTTHVLTTDNKKSDQMRSLSWALLAVGKSLYSIEDARIENWIPLVLCATRHHFVKTKSLSTNFFELTWSSKH